MFFESFIVDIIKKHIGDYIENFDHKLRFRKGIVELKNLDIKENALDSLDLPVKIKTGHIKQIKLLTQLTNLHKKPLAVIIDGLYVLVVPNVAPVYNEENEEKAKQKSKQKHIQRIEDAIKLDDEKDQQTLPEEQKKESFSEKIAVHILKYLEVKVTNVHVRYEDNYTNPIYPFSFGLSLKELHLKTTNKNLEECAVKKSETQIFKVIRLDSLAVYWNVKTELYDSKSKTNVLLNLTNGVADRENDHGFQYLMKPLSAEAIMCLNTKPELNNFCSPNIFLTIPFDAITVEISKQQFISAVEMIESFKALKLRHKNKKHRPSDPIKNNAKQWWNYAGNIILHDIHRRRGWSWSYIETSNMKLYKNVYAKKLKRKTLNEDDKKNIDKCERNLNVLSIILLRQEAEIELLTHALSKEEGFFGRKKRRIKLIADIKKKFVEKFTASEKVKLYEAIGYDKKRSDTFLPKEFISEHLEMTCKKMTLSLKDSELKNPYIITFQLEDVSSSFGHRTAANAIEVQAKVKKYTVKGTQQNGQIPVLAFSQTTETDNNNTLLDVLYETNPLDKGCDSRVKLNIGHVEFIYDSVTVNNVVKFVKPSDNVDVQQLSTTAVATFEAIKEYSATELRHAIEKTNYTKITVDIQPSFVIIPNKGFFTNECRALIVDLGHLQVVTQERPFKFTSPHQDEQNQVQNPVQGLSREENEEKGNKVKKEAYDRFVITLDQLQILFSSSGEEWRVCRRESHSDRHILEPITIKLDLQKCMFETNLALSNMKMSGELPLLSLNISDQTLHDLIELAYSIPLPKSELVPRKEIFLANSIKNMKMKDKAIVETAKSRVQPNNIMKFPNYAKMEINFEIKQVDINISEVDNGQDIQVVRLVAASLGTEVAITTYHITLAAYLKGINLQHKTFVAYPAHTSRGDPQEVNCHVVNIVNTPVEDEAKKLLQLHYIKAKENGPNFATTYNKVKQKINLQLTSLLLHLHQQELSHIVALLDKLKPALKKQPEIVTFPTEERQDSEWMNEQKKEQKKKSTTRKQYLCELKIKFGWESVSAIFYEDNDDLTQQTYLHMQQRTDKAGISKITLEMMDVSCEQMSNKSMEVYIKLKDIFLDDLRDHKIHGITRMIQMREFPLFVEESRNMINVIYKKHCCEYPFTMFRNKVYVKINNLQIIVCLDYLKSIENFAIKCMPKKEQRKNHNEDKIKKPSSPFKCIDFDVTIEKPEIVLIEDQLNHNCNCLVLTTEPVWIEINLKSEVIFAVVIDLQIFSCVFSNRTAVTAKILNNCDIYLTRVKYFGKCTETSIETSVLEFNISPAIVKTTYGICAGLAFKPKKKPKEESYTYKVPQDLWAVKQLSESDFWFLKSKDEFKIDVGETVDELIEDEVILEKVIANIPSMVIHIEGVVEQKGVPLLKVESSVSGEVKYWNTKSSVESIFKLEMAYYNEKLSVWEPLLEPVIDEDKMKRWELGLEVKMNAKLFSILQEKGLYFEKLALPPKMTVTVFSHDVMQMTLSKTCLEVLHKLYKAFRESFILNKHSDRATKTLLPFCITNKTGLEVVIQLDKSLELPEAENILQVRLIPGEKLEVRNRNKDPSILAAQTKKNVFYYFQLKPTRLKIANEELTDWSDWSDMFFLDKVGNSCVIHCKFNNGQTFTVGLTVALSSSGLTKMCTFTPFYTLINTSKYVVLCQEMNQEGNNWTKIASKECKPFWSVQSGKNLTMKAKFSGSAVETSPFLFSEPHTSLMKLSDKHGGLNVDCQVNESSTVITLSEYMDGMAPVLLVNHTDKEVIQFHQSGSNKKHALNAQQFMLYAWEDVFGNREVTWTCGKNWEKKEDLQKECSGAVHVDAHSVIYWASFPDGKQRVLLFTKDPYLFYEAKEADEFEHIEQEFNICIRGLCLSLVNDYKQQELAYIGITSSEIFWEEKIMQFTSFNRETGVILEEGYKRYINRLNAGRTTSSRDQLQKNIEVDWKEMMMYKSNHAKQRRIRRRFPEGIMLQYQTSRHKIQLHATIQRLQCDNQMDNAIFQTLLAPSPIEKSKAATSIPKPFTEFRMIVKKSNHSKTLHLKFCKILVQEMMLKVDLYFISELLDLWPTFDCVTKDQQTTLRETYDQAERFTQMKKTSLSLAQQIFFAYLHISPIKLHLYISNQGCGRQNIQRLIRSYKTKTFLRLSEVINLNVHDAILKFGYFEKKQKFYNLNQLRTYVLHHFKSQAKSQIPFCLFFNDASVEDTICVVDDIKEHFYEPYKGNIQEPGDCQEDMSLNEMHMLDGSGRGVARSLCDFESQSLGRNDMSRKRPTGEIALNLMVGALEKLIEKFKDRPASATVDFTSSSFEGITRIADISIQSRRLRNPRMINIDKIIRPYNRREADGYRLLREIGNGKFAATDRYVAHMNNETFVFFITDIRVICANKLNTLGGSFGYVRWSCPWEEIQDTKKYTRNCILIELKKRSSMMSLPLIVYPIYRYVRFPDVETTVVFHGMIEKFMKSQK